MAKIVGRVQVFANGLLLLNKEGAKAINIGEFGKPPVLREPVVGDGGIHGFKETIQVAELEVTITDSDVTSIGTLMSINGDGTIVFRTHGGGKSYVMEQATASGVAEVTAGEGEAPIRFMGKQWTELVV